MIIRTFDIVMIGALLFGVTWTFKVKNESEQALQRVAELEAQISAEREAIDLLRADWSLLTSPDRLAKLAERHQAELGLEPAKPENIVTFGDLPAKRPEFVPGTLDSALLDKPDNAIVTGSIEEPGESSMPDAIRSMIEGSMKDGESAIGISAGEGGGNE